MNTVQRIRNALQELEESRGEEPFCTLKQVYGITVEDARSLLEEIEVSGCVFNAPSENLEAPWELEKWFVTNWVKDDLQFQETLAPTEGDMLRHAGSKHATLRDAELEENDLREILDGLQREPVLEIVSSAECIKTYTPYSSRWTVEDIIEATERRLKEVHEEIRCAKSAMRAQSRKLARDMSDEEIFEVVVHWNRKRH